MFGLSHQICVGLRAHKCSLEVQSARPSCESALQKSSPARALMRGAEPITHLCGRETDIDSVRTEEAICDMLLGGRVTSLGWKWEAERKVYEYRYERELSNR